MKSKNFLCIEIEWKTGQRGKSECSLNDSGLLVASLSMVLHTKLKSFQSARKHKVH